MQAESVAGIVSNSVTKCRRALLPAIPSKRRPLAFSYYKSTFSIAMLLLASTLSCADTALSTRVSRSDSPVSLSRPHGVHLHFPGLAHAIFLHRPHVFHPINPAAPISLQPHPNIPSDLSVHYPHSIRSARDAVSAHCDVLPAPAVMQRCCRLPTAAI